MKTSDSIIKIAPALLKAQLKMGSAKKDSKNPYFKSSYADLPAVMEACKDALNENGIVTLQPINHSILETYLIHETGEWMQSETEIICKEPNNPQAYGSAITYARRYGLQSFLFIPAEDDDGNAASQQPRTVDRFTTWKHNLMKAKTVEDLDSADAKLQGDAYFRGDEKIALQQTIEQRRKELENYLID